MVDLTTGLTPCLAFKQIRLHAGVHRDGGARCQPHLHDLRHTAAVHRLTRLYQEGEDVQKLLSVYMGHTLLGGHTEVPHYDARASARGWPAVRTLTQRGRAAMTKANLLGPWVRPFLLEYLVSERNLARNTHRSYRDALSLLLPFVAQQRRKEVDQISVIDVSPDLARLFLRHLVVESCSHCTQPTLVLVHPRWLAIPAGWQRLIDTWMEVV